MRKLLLPAALLLCSFLSFSQNQPATIKELTDAISGQMKQQHITGLLLGITTNDSVIFSGGLGYADLETKRPVDGTTLFRMGSITKMFVSLGILQLLKEGKFSLNDEVKKIAPEVPIINKWEAQHPVRVINLLEHTAGFDDIKLNKLYAPGKDLKGLDRVLEQKNSLVCRWQPGERFAYSNPGYAVLGYLLEKFSGQPYEQYLSGLLLRPLGMTHSNFNINNRLPEQETWEYYVKDGKTAPAHTENMLIGPAGALWSCADDMLKFVRLFLNNGDSLFSDSLINVMETPQSSLGAKAGLSTCYALANQVDLLDTKFAYRGHGGLAGACFSSFKYNREIGVGFIVASNSNNNLWAIDRLIARFIEQHIVPGKNPPPLYVQKVNADEIKPWLGRYQLESPRNEIAGFKDRLLMAPKIYLQNNKLFFEEFMGNTSELVQTGTHTFAWKGTNAPVFVFTHNDKGEKVMILGGVYFEKVSNGWAMTKRVGVAIVVLFAVLSYLLAVVTLIQLLFKKVSVRNILLRILPAIALTLLIWGILNMLEVQQYSFRLGELATINTRSLSVFIGTTVFAIVTLLTLVVAIKDFRKTKKAFAVYFLLTAISFAVITAVLWQAGWIGLRTWAM